MKWWIGLTAIALMGGGWAGTTVNSDHDRPQVRAQLHPLVHAEYPVVTSVEALVNQASLVVIGQVQQATATENLARNPKEPAQPDPHFELRGVDYTFRVERFLKGSGPNELRVTDTKSVAVDGGAPVPMDGYVEMPVGGRYLFFLRRSPEGRWLGIAEPWRFELRQGSAVVSSGWEGAAAHFPPFAEIDLLAKVKAAVTVHLTPASSANSPTHTAADPTGTPPPPSP